MSNPIIDYTFNGPSTSNPDGSFPLLIPEDALVPGPGIWSGLNLPSAVGFNQTGPLVIGLRGISTPATRKFRAGVVFRFDGEIPPLGAPYPPQTLFLSYFIPFRLELVLSEGKLRLRSSTTVTYSDLRQQTSFTQIFQYSPPTPPEIVPGEWYSADLVWDEDKNILVTFLSGPTSSVPVSCHGFGPDARVHVSGRVLLIGGPDGAPSPQRFNGAIAAVLLESGLSSTLMDTRLQLQKKTPLYYITTKLELLRGDVDLQDPIGPIILASSGTTSTQEYVGGQITYTAGQSEAYVLHSDFWEAYKVFPVDIKDGLGYQITDVSSWTYSNGQRTIMGRGGDFSKGQLITSTSPRTGIFAIFGPIMRGRSADGGMSPWGFPLENQHPIRGGIAQQYEYGTWYYKDGASDAYGLHNELDGGYRREGGPDKWGLPLSNEETLEPIPIRSPPGSEWVLAASKVELEGDATVSWCETRGSFIVSGPIRSFWKAPTGAPLFDYWGPPESSEQGIPDADPAQHMRQRMQSFMYGLMTYNPATASFQNIRVFGLKLMTIKTLPEPTEVGGLNDLYLWIEVEYHGLDTEGVRTGSSSTHYLRRFPEGNTAWQNQNELTPNLYTSIRIVPDSYSEYVIRVTAMDKDTPFLGQINRDDLIGQGSISLKPQNRYLYTQPSTRGFTVGLRRLGTLSSTGSAYFEFEWLVV